MAAFTYRAPTSALKFTPALQNTLSILEAPESLYDIGASKEDVFLAKMSRGYNLQKVAGFLEMFNDYNDLMSWCALAVNKRPGNGKILHDVSKAKRLLKVDQRVLEDEYEKMIIDRKIVEPTSAGSALANCAVIKCLGPTSTGLLYSSVTGARFEVNMIDRTTWFKDVSAILFAAAPLEKKRVYTFCPYDPYLIMASWHLTARYTIAVVGGKSKVDKRAGALEPPVLLQPVDQWKSASSYLDGYYNEFSKTLNGHVMPVPTELNELALFYSLLWSVGWKPQQEMADLMQSLDAAAPAVKIGATDEEMKQQAAELAVNWRNDRLVNEARAYLKSSRDYRDKIKPLDKASHNICNECELQYVPEDKWGPLHRQHVIMETLKQFKADHPKREITTLHLIGPGSEKVARGLSVTLHSEDPKAEPKAKYDLFKEVHIWQSAGSVVTSGYKSHMTKDLKMRDLFADSDSMIVITDFTQVIEFGATDKKNLDNAMLLLAAAIPRDFNGIVVAHGTMMNSGRFFQVMSQLYDKEFYVHLIRHPRRHNVTIFAGIYKQGAVNKPDVGAAAKFQIGMACEVIANNILRDNCIWFGMDAKRSTNINTGLLECYGDQMNVRDEFRTLKTLDKGITADTYGLVQKFTASHRVDNDKRNQAAIIPPVVPPLPQTLPPVNDTPVDIGLIAAQMITEATATIPEAEAALEITDTIVPPGSSVESTEPRATRRAKRSSRELSPPAKQSRSSDSHPPP